MKVEKDSCANCYHENKKGCIDFRKSAYLNIPKSEIYCCCHSTKDIDPKMIDGG